MAQLTDRWMILVAGPMRSGKSTLGGRIVERFGGVRVGFGDAVRHRAQTLGLPAERRLLQQIGEEWVARDPGGLCDAVLAPSIGEAVVVVDGVRHQQVHSLLRARSQGRRVILVFVDADVSVRRDRLALDGISDEAIDRVVNHSADRSSAGRRDLGADWEIAVSRSAFWRRQSAPQHRRGLPLRRHGSLLRRRRQHRVVLGDRLAEGLVSGRPWWSVPATL